MTGIDQEKAAEMLGKVVLAGVSFCNAAGEVIENRQYFGTVLRINEQEGLVIVSGIDGKEVKLPPDLEQYIPASPGTYTLKAIERVVVNPDYVSTWSVHPSGDDREEKGT
ncbi:MAG TPA: hypothetical protein VNQ90_12140 [Chthoniobacteraceae bacterium]|nr:hypothetical protein [Chthoniobacteraceae bacterium]